MPKRLCVGDWEPGDRVGEGVSIVKLVFARPILMGEPFRGR